MPREEWTEISPIIGIYQESLNLSEFVVASKRAQTRKAEAKAEGEKAYKAIAEEQRAFQNLCEAAYTVNGRQRVQ
jgi:hypothetical protein